MSDIVVESPVNEQFILAGFAVVPPKRQTTVALGKLSAVNRTAVVRSLKASVDAGRIKIVSGEEHVGGDPVHVHHIKRDSLGTVNGVPIQGRSETSAVQTDPAARRNVAPAPTILSDAERAVKAADEAAKLEADKKALAEKEAADKAAADKAAAEQAAAAKIEADRIAAEQAAAEKQAADAAAAAAASAPVPPAPPAPPTTPTTPSNPASDL